MRLCGRSRRRACCLITWYLAGLSLAFPSISGRGVQAATVIRDALLIDGTGRPPKPGMDIVIREGRIEGIGPVGTIEAPRTANVIDASGKTVIPGIINLRGRSGLVLSPERTDEHFSRVAILEQLRTYASYGITTTTSPYPSGARLKSIQAEVEAGTVASAARVLTPVRRLVRSSSECGRRLSADRLAECVRSEREARRAVDRLVREGADYVELQEPARDVNGSRDIRIPVAIMRRARRHQLPVSVLASSTGSAAVLVRAGARVLVQSVADQEIPSSSVDAWRAAGIIYVPALTAQSAGFEHGDGAAWLDDRYLRRSLAPGVTALLRGPLRTRQALDPDRALKIHRFKVAQRNLRKLAAGGVRIGFAGGSGQPGNFEGYSEYREAVLMARSGLSPMDVIRSFSHGSAVALGIDAERGTLERGHVADLIILNANPLDNIHNLRELHAVLVRGRLVKL